MKKKPRTRTKLGSIWVDTATLVVGDPCQLIHDDRGNNQKQMTYMEFVDKLHPYPTSWMPEQEEGESDKDYGKRCLKAFQAFKKEQPPPDHLKIMNAHGRIGAIAIKRDSDGYYPVYIVRNAKGTPIRLEIGLTAMVKP